MYISLLFTTFNSCENKASLYLGFESHFFWLEIRIKEGLCGSAGRQWAAEPPCQSGQQSSLCWPSDIMVCVWEGILDHWGLLALAGSPSLAFWHKRQSITSSFLPLALCLPALYASWVIPCLRGPLPSPLHPFIQNPFILTPLFCVYILEPRGQTAANALCLHTWLLPWLNLFHTLILVILHINYSGPPVYEYKSIMSALLHSASIRRLGLKLCRGMADQEIKGFMRPTPLFIQCRATYICNYLMATVLLFTRLGLHTWSPGTLVHADSTPSYYLGFISLKQQ